MAQRKKEDQRIPALEWFAALLGLAIILAMLGFLLIEALRSESRKPPLMHVEFVGLTAGEAGHVLEVKVVNSSGQTGAAVQIEGELKDGGRVVETSNANVSYVPGESQRRAGLIFKHDPRRYEVELRVTGYEQP